MIIKCRTEPGRHMDYMIPENINEVTELILTSSVEIIKHLDDQINHLPGYMRSEKGFNILMRKFYDDDADLNNSFMIFHPGGLRRYLSMPESEGILPLLYISDIQLVTSLII